MNKLCVGILAAFVLAGCGSDSSDTSSTAAKSGGGEITFQVAGSPDEFPLYREVAKQFTDKTGTKVKLVEIADEEAFGTKLATSISAGKAPDVALISYRGYKRYAEEGQIIPIGPLVEDKLGGYYEEPLKAFTDKGEVQCLPQNLSSLVVYYNRDLFKKAGLDDPAADWSYDDLIAAAKKIQGTETEAGEAYGVSIEKELIRLAPFIWSAGGEVADDEDAPTKLTFDTPEARRGIEHFVGLAKYGADPDEAESESEDELFIKGRLGMVLASRKKVPTFRKAEFDWDVAPFPEDKEKVTVLHTDGFCMIKGADEDKASAFIEFAGGLEGQKILTDLGRVVPSIKSLAESDEFLKSGPPANNQVYVDAEKIMRILPTVKDSPAIEVAVEKALEQAYFGRITVDAFIERVEKETTPIFGGEIDQAELDAEIEREAAEKEREASGEGGGETEAEREAEAEKEAEAESTP
jgi:multiple sugar transport system substrate-binding protein